MNTKTLTPNFPSTKLAMTPKFPPFYSTKVTTESGESIELADPKATRALIALMDMQAVMGGAASHFGGPSAFAELMSAAHGLMFQDSKRQGKDWTELYHFVNDAGHCENGLYALRANYGFADLSIESLKGFRSLRSPLAGHGEAHLFPEGVYLSNGPLGSSLPQAQGLALAEKLSGCHRTTVVSLSDGACMEGEAKEALAAIPGLAAKGQMAPFVLLISDNDTKLSGRIAADSFSMEPTFQSLENLGWEVMLLEHAHDLQACFSCLEKAFEVAKTHPEKPVVVHAKTIKGFGVSSLENSASGGHGFPLKDPEELPNFLSEIYGDGEVPEDMKTWISEMCLQAKEAMPSKSTFKKEKVQVGISKALINSAQQGLPLVSITSDLPGSTGVAGFRKEFPKSSFDVGVAESNMISVAAGFSKQGFIPVVDTFSQFGVTKGALPLIMASLSLSPLIAIFSHAGFQDAADGASHQALSYFAMTHSIPKLRTFCLATSQEAEHLLGQAVEEFHRKQRAGGTPESYVFFLGRENFIDQIVGYESGYKLGCSQVYADTVDEPARAVTLLAAGPLVHQALEASDILKSKGVGSLVINASAINRPDLPTLKAAVEKTQGRLITVEDHQIIGGMGAVALQALVSEGVTISVCRHLGVRGGFGQSAYTAQELYEKHGLSASEIAKAAELLVKV